MELICKRCGSPLNSYLICSCCETFHTMLYNRHGKKYIDISPIIHKELYEKYRGGLKI